MAEVSEEINRSNTICHYKRFPGFLRANCNACRVGFPKLVDLLRLFAEYGLGALIATFIDAPKKFSPHPNYDSQLTALDKTKDAIQSLIGFIDDQKKQIQLSQNAVDALKTEEGRIHPLVEADRKVIDSLFAVQEQRNQNAQSHERLVGFWQGVLASLVATILSAFGAMLYKRRVRPKASSVQ